MNVMSWNCRDSGGTTGYTLNRYLRCTKPQIAFILETRCDFIQATERIKALPLCNSIIVPSQGQSGGLWFLWNDEFKVSLIEKSSNFIVVQMERNGVGTSWLCCGVYGDPNRVGNQMIWDSLEKIMDDFEGHICLMGDFNAITSSNEKSGGNPQLSQNNIAFRQWIHGVGLLDMGHQGPAYTWSNKKNGGAHIAERLDRVLVNLQWQSLFPRASVFHLPRFSSDYMPIILRTESKHYKTTSSFRCENWWGLDEQFQRVCQVVEQKKDEKWGQLTKSFKFEVKRWLKNRVTPQRILTELEQEMAKVNAATPGSVNQEEENELQLKHQRCLMMNQSYWQQRSRIDWMIFGDNNTRFFHATAVSRKRRNSINAIFTDAGNWVTNGKEIRKLFVSHFKSIYTKRATATV